MRLLAPLLSLLAVSAPASAEAIHDEQLWLNATVIGTLPGSRVAYFLEAQPRFTDGADRLGTLILRPAIGWKFSNAATAYAGYAHVETPLAGARDRNEERLFAQLSWTLPKRGAGTLSSRTRIEHRRLSDGDDSGWRLREMVRYSHPIAGTGGVRALVFGEAFVALNDTDWGARRGFDQLRTFLGAEIPLAGRSTVEAGYLNQLVNAPGGVTRINHALALTLWVRP